MTASSGVAVPAQLRAAGAQTVYWQMKLGALVGTTTAPADPATITASVDKLFTNAVASTGCETPYIALNELNGASTTTPWTGTNSRYRQNILDVLRALQAKGARPFLLVSSFPYTGGDAAGWWREAAQAADLVPEVYFNAPAVMRQGVILGSRRMRTTLRNAIAAYTAIGIPVAKLGVVLGFQSGPGAGGREGLQPSEKWFRFTKLYTLAAKRVAAEFGIATVWSWGWGTFNTAGADPDKQAAACVFLWTRDASLCDGPAAGGQGFEDSRVEGQLETIPAGAQCTLDGRALRQTDLSRMTAVTHDRDVAFTVLYDRLVETGLAKVSDERVTQAIQAIVDGVFSGTRPAYNAALAKGGATRSSPARAVADELLRAQIEGALRCRLRPTSRPGSSTAPTRPCRSARSGSTRRRRGSAIAARGSRLPRPRPPRSSGFPRRSRRRSPPASACSPSRRPRCATARCRPAQSRARRSARRSSPSRGHRPTKTQPGSAQSRP